MAAFCAWPLYGAKDRKRQPALPEHEIRDLSNAIKAAPSYREDLRHALDSIEDSFALATDELERSLASLELARRFRPVNTDSSLYYARRARAIAATIDEPLCRQTDIAIIEALATAGLFTEAVEMFTALDPARLAHDIRLDYWLAGRRLYGYMKSYAQGDRDCYVKYDTKYQQFDDSLILHLPARSQLRSFLVCERQVSEKRFHEAREGLEKLLADLPQDDNLYGMAAFQMAEVWRNLGNETRYASLLALSALSDVKGCVTEGLALPTLAQWLYERGELGESFLYINFALEEASAANARMRAVTIARFVPLIDDAYNERINTSRDELMVYFLLVTVLLIVTGVLIAFLVKQNRKSRANASKLAQTSRRQESYIGNFIGLYSSYAERLNRLTTLVSAKLASGQTAELKKLIESGRFTDQDNDDIHKIFDSAFLDIYPDFLDKINTLLRPDETISVKAQGALTPELRIYAFVKLGVDESSKIAQILHYSINTVYAYRNKMRNKAITRETFDADVKNL